MSFSDFFSGTGQKDASRERTADKAVSDKDIPAEHIAAIAAAVAAMYADIPEEHIAVIAAAIAAYEGAGAGEVTGAVPVLNIRRGFNVWAMAGRQDAMAARKLH